MIKGVDGGTTAPIPQDNSVEQQQPAKSTDAAQSTPQQDSAETLKGAQSNATARAAESSITSKVLASQLQVQLDSKPIGAPASPEVPSDKKPLLVKDGNNNPADVKDMQHQLNE